MSGTRTYGTLLKWNEERGFGFVVPVGGREEIFVHISAFPRDGKRPAIGEVISFDVQEAPGGKQKGVNITRPGGRMPAARRDYRSTSLRKPWAAVVAVLAIGTLSVYGGRALLSPSVGTIDATAYPAESPAMHRSGETDDGFTCDGRTHCSQMTSCAEAVYFLKHCPNTEMDGNGDGEPCEQQWCK